LFQDILRVTKSHGFKTSPYPIVLSFENHCSVEVCDRMAVLLEEVLGDMLVRPAEVAGQAFVNILGQEGLLSPERLRNRVLVKATAVTESSEALELLAADEADEDERPAKDSGPKRDRLSVALSKLVYLKATRLKRFKDAELWTPTQMCSFSEPRIWKHFARGDAGVLEMAEFCHDHIARIYPRGTRFDSSNFDPILPWLAGCQMVALNYQTPGPAMWVNEAKFRENGYSGYNLRVPEKLPCNFLDRAKLGEGISRPKPTFSKLTVRIFGARLLPPATQGGGKELVHFVVQVLDGESDFKYRSQMSSNWLSPDVLFDQEIPVVDTCNGFLLISAVCGSETIVSASF
jgi:phosphatidylinositol phospholipase C delta